MINVDRLVPNVDRLAPASSTLLGTLPSLPSTPKLVKVDVLKEILS